jgi:type IV pilus assembly protein PilM
MPKMSEKELRSAVPFEAENYIPLTIDKVYWDFQTIDAHKEGGANHLDLLINVMPKPIVDSYVYAIKKAGLVPAILEVESQAIVSALVKEKEILPPTIFIDLGQDNTSFIIFSGGSIRFTSSLSVYSGQMTQTISSKLGVDLKEAEKLKLTCGLVPGGEKKYDLKVCLDPILYNLADEIKRYISFYKGHTSHEYSLTDKKIEKVVLSGGGANLKGLPEFLFNELKIPVEFGDPFTNVVIQKKKGLQIPKEKALSFTTAIGLALRGVNDELIS